MLAMVALALASAAVAQTTYRLEQIGPDPTPTGFYYGNDMNDRGEVVGGVYGTFTGWLWKDGTLTPIPALPGSTDGRSEALGINNRTQVVGTSAGRPYVWQRGHLRDTGAFPGANAGAIDINSLGVILGSVSGVSSLMSQPFLQLGSLTRTLDALPGDTLAFGVRINELGSVCGNSGTPTTQRAVIWEWGRIRALGLLPGAYDSIARAINNRNEVAGEMRFNGGSDTTAVIWSHGQIHELPKLFVGPFSRAYATGINDRGQAVGVNTGGSGGAVAALWQNEMIYDLNDLIRADDPLRPFVTVEQPLVINNRGQILVTGVDSRFAFGQIPYRLVPSGHL
jgi:probable HAF family extracellular repeat protein